jgi:23S rRNA (adenine2503-C2)-methyltransferase
MIEYAMIKNLNDSKQNAKDLAALFKGKLCVVNLIPYNETNCFSSSDTASINTFKDVLRSEGINVVQRHRFGDDIDAACGQLAAKIKNNHISKNVKKDVENKNKTNFFKPSNRGKPKVNRKKQR